MKTLNARCRKCKKINKIVPSKDYWEDSEEGEEWLCEFCGAKNDLQDYCGCEDNPKQEAKE